MRSEQNGESGDDSGSVVVPSNNRGRLQGNHHFNRGDVHDDDYEIVHDLRNS